MGEKKKISFPEQAKRDPLFEEMLPALRRHLSLSAPQNRLMETDFEKAIAFYRGRDLSDDRIRSLVSPERLGGFYARPATVWYPLDNAAKIYPLSMTRGKMAIFRLSVYLKEPVVPEILQLALDYTIKRFPVFATTLKKGFFWYYLDSAKRRFLVEKGRAIPCQPISISGSGSQSFRVLYYEERISVELFHVLCDGTGGMVFLKTLTGEYLRLLGNEIPYTDTVWNVDDVPDPSETENAFLRVERQKSASGFMGKLATQMSGKRTRLSPCQVLHFVMDTNKLREVSKSYGGTVTAYLLSLMFIANKYATEEREGTIQIQVPVNMRKYYDSRTVRNFSLYFSAALSLEEITTVEEMIPKLMQQIREKGSKECMDEMMYAAVLLVKSLQFVPVLLKKPVAEIIYGFLGDGIVSNTLSNLGQCTVPEEMEPFIDRFDFILGGGAVQRAGCSVVSFGNKTVFSVSKHTADPSFEERFYRLISEAGIPVEVEGSEMDAS
ncbi:MAG: hypothetical protein IJ091_06255 [Oscillospiraceae bacterium]|nr:hypothetical protein [Oscillospiraceae bacterium]